MKRILMLMLLATLLFGMFPAAQAQAGFTLVSPSGSTLVRNKSTDLAVFSWTPLAGTTNYVLSVFKVSTNPRDTPLGEIFNQSYNPVNCSATLCAHVPSGPQLALIDRGAYAWTVVANTPGGDVEASNGAIFFSYDPLAIALMTNPGFDTGSPSPWTVSGLAGDSVKAGSGVGGTYGFYFKGSSGESALIKQSRNVTFYHIGTSDTLTLSVDYKAGKPNVMAKASIKIKYSSASGLPADKVSIVFSQHSVFFTATQGFVPAGPVKKIEVRFLHNSLKGAVVIDNLQATLAGQP